MTIEKFFAGESTMPYPFFMETNNLNLDDVINSVEIPFFVLHGVDDAQTSFKVAKEYYESVNAPLKTFYTFEKSSHSLPFEETEIFYQVMDEIVNLTEFN